MVKAPGNLKKLNKYVRERTNTTRSKSSSLNSLNYLKS